MGNFSFPIFFCNFTFQTGILHKIPESQNVRTMKHILLTSALSLIALLSSASTTGVPESGWESVKSDVQDTRMVVKEPEIEIRTAPLLIVVSTSQQVRIKIFSILGRLVSDATLQPGTSRLSLDSHGVYIVKAGTLTCKVAI